VQKLQNFAAKVVDGKAKKYDHVTHILKELKWIRIEERYKLEICFFVYKILNGEFYAPFMPMLTVGQVRQTRSRQANDLFIPRFNTDMGSRAVTIRGPTLYNALPEDIRNSGNKVVFKTKLQNYFLEN